MKILNRKGLILVITGVVCVILLLVTSPRITKTEAKESDYCIETEQKLTELISGLSGVDDVRVMLTLECGSEFVYAVDSESSADRTRSEYYSAGEKEALLIKEIAPVIKGVGVVCRGKGAQTEAEVTELVSRVLDLPLSRIFVSVR
ncbi:MAG: hypothetical protein IKT46_05800 [Clostridia bacterium]|nr:hypothetical protein [Clostridia bacterium]